MHKTLKKGKLVLKDGSVYEGTLYGKRDAVGEVVFTTGMFSYQETLTDPSFCGQIVVMTYPLIGNYGCNDMFNQSRKSFFQGFVVGELCDTPSNWRSEESLLSFLDRMDVPVLVGVDTRAITRRLRDHGVAKGVIVPADTPQEEIDRLLAAAEAHAQVAEVTTPEIYTMGDGKHHVAVIDLGAKKNALELLQSFDCRLTVFPATATAEEVLAHNPEGVFLTNGPGNPEDVPEAVEQIKKLQGRLPIMGVSLGHQLLALAAGARTAKMKFGHRGASQPVKDLRSGRVYITTQNHGYVVEEESLAGKEIEITHVSVNDGTVEGLEYPGQKALSVQYCPEDAEHAYLFQKFIDLMEGR